MRTERRQMYELVVF